MAAAADGPSVPEATSSARAAAVQPDMADETAWQVEAKLSLAIERAQALLGARYASSSIDNESRTWRLYSTATPSSAILTALRTLTGRLVRIEVRTVAHSLKTLRTVQAAIDAVAATPAGRPINSTVVDADANVVRVSVTTAKPPGFVQSLLTLGPVGSIDVTEDDGTFMVPEESQLDGRIPYKAGKYAKLPDSPEFGRCTAGFVWRSGNEYLGSTAGHCLLNNSAFYLGTKSTTFYGFGYRNQFTGRSTVSADVVFVRGAPATNYTPPFLWDDFNKTRRFNLKFSNQPRGVAVRMVGATTINGSSGLISQEHYSGRSQNGGFYYTDATCAGYLSDGGDSGAPIFNRSGASAAIAYGMHFSSFFVNGRRAGGCFADIDNIERAGAVTLLTD